MATGVLEIPRDLGNISTDWSANSLTRHMKSRLNAGLSTFLEWDRRKASAWDAIVVRRQNRTGKSGSPVDDAGAFRGGGELMSGSRVGDAARTQDHKRPIIPTITAKPAFLVRHRYSVRVGADAIVQSSQ